MSYRPKRAKPGVEYDLHNHSRLSLGAKISPSLLVDLAVSRGLSGLGICEEDAFWDEDLPERMAERPLRLAMGIEFTCRGAHIIGFGMRFSPADRAFLEEYFTGLRAQARRAAREFLTELADWLPGVSPTALTCRLDSPVDKPSILHCLIRELRLFPDEAQGRIYLSARGLDLSPYGQAELLDPREAVALIHRSGGVSILAQPYMDIVPADLPGLLRDLADAGLDAVECIYAYRENGYMGNESNEVLQARSVALAHKHGLRMSGGSGTRYPLGPMQDLRPILPGEYGLTAEEAQSLVSIF